LPVGVETEVVPVCEPPPQAESVNAAAIKIRTGSSILRRRAGKPMSSKDARAAPPTAREKIPNGWGADEALEPVVVTVTVAFTAAVPVMFSVEGTVQAGWYAAPLEPPLTLQLRLTVPVKPFCGVTATVAELLIPGERISMLPPEIRVTFGAAAIMTPSCEVSAGRAVPFQEGFSKPYDSAAP
jgi:hypothetical protein